MLSNNITQQYYASFNGDHGMTRRSRLSVIYLILSYIFKYPGIKATHLTYKANISYAQLQSYTKLLDSLGLIEIQKKEKITSFKITEKGKKVLRILEDLEKVLYEDETVKIRQIL